MNFVFPKQLDRLPVQFNLWKYSPIERELNDLIQRNVEHGFVQFYNRHELFIGKLTQKLSQEHERFQSQAITMDNIWIYVHIFAVANCFSFTIFLCEIIIFHRREIWRAVVEAYHTCCYWFGSWWRQLITKIHTFVRMIIDTVGNMYRRT